MIRLEPDCDFGKLKSVKLTLTTADTVRTIAIPNWAHGWKIRSDKLIRFAIGEDPPAAEAAVADASVIAANLGIGGYIFPNETEVRLMPERISTLYTLRLLDDVGGAVVYIEFFAG